jgi:hypothetical protein
MAYSKLEAKDDVIKEKYVIADVFFKSNTEKLPTLFKK